MALYVYQLMKAGGGSCWGGNVTVFACIIITALLNRFQIPNNITNKELVIFPKNNVKNVYLQCKKPNSPWPENRNKDFYSLCYPKGYNFMYTVKCTVYR